MLVNCHHHLTPAASMPPSRPSSVKRATSPAGKPSAPGGRGKPAKSGGAGAADLAPAPDSAPESAPEPEPEPEPEVEQGAAGPDDLVLDFELSDALALIRHESYWMRRAKAHKPTWLALDPQQHGGSWKALYCERLVACRVAETRGEEDTHSLAWTVAACAPYLRALTLHPSHEAPEMHLGVLFRALNRHVHAKTFVR